MALILVGQTELRTVLAAADLRGSRAQRVNLRFHLAGLSAQETKAYIQHRLQVAGVKHALFSEEAIAVNYHFSKGVYSGIAGRKAPERFRFFCV
jgi:type II secretory pathway predicted ATPase ExeA